MDQHQETSTNSECSRSADHAIPEGKNEKSEKKSSNEEEEEGWSPEEHKLFLEGVKKYGRGDWKTISREFVLSRTPAQVNSHAQKYFALQESRPDVVKKKTGFPLEDKFGASAYDFYDPNHFMDLEDVVLFFSTSD